MAGVGGDTRLCRTKLPIGYIVGLKRDTIPCRTKLPIGYIAGVKGDTMSYKTKWHIALGIPLVLQAIQGQTNWFTEDAGSNRTYNIMSFSLPCYFASSLFRP